MSAAAGEVVYYVRRTPPSEINEEYLRWAAHNDSTVPGAVSSLDCADLSSTPGCRSPIAMFTHRYDDLIRSRLAVLSWACSPPSSASSSLT